MKIAVLKEAAGETRCAAIPETVRKFIALGAEVAIEAGAGEGASISRRRVRGGGRDSRFAAPRFSAAPASCLPSTGRTRNA